MNTRFAGKRFSRNSVIGFGICLTLYLLWLIFFIGFGTHHFISTAIFCFFYFFRDNTRGILLGMFGFFIFWLLYDSMRFFPSYLYNQVHIAEPYEIEMFLFGFVYEGTKIIPCEYFANHHHPLIDLFTGFTYLMWMPIPMMYAIYLYFKNRKHMIYFSATFLITNIIGISIYYAYPAAPPWYVAQYGITENFDILGSAAGFLRFDELLGIHIFEDMYVKNSNVFAAIPSLHAAYPTLMVFFALKNKNIGPKIVGTLLLCGIWFGAVYSSHHYIIDVLLGIFCAIFALLAFYLIKEKTGKFDFLDRFANYIE